jgi:hypothetical protein
MKIIITESSRDRLVLKWLNKEFGDLTPVVSDDKTFYVDKNRIPLFYHQNGRKTNHIYVNYERMWIFFKSIFGLDGLEAEEIMKVWLEETYNLRNAIPTWSATWWTRSVVENL